MLRMSGECEEVVDCGRVLNACSGSFDGDTTGVTGLLLMSGVREPLNDGEFRLLW